MVKGFSEKNIRNKERVREQKMDRPGPQVDSQWILSFLKKIRHYSPVYLCSQCPSRELVATSCRFLPIMHKGWSPIRPACIVCSAYLTY